MRFTLQIQIIPKERKRWSLSSNHTKAPFGRLTWSVIEDHNMRIFSTYGKMIGKVVERMHPHLCNSYEYTEFENPDEAKKAQKLLDARQVHGQEITATTVSSPLA